MLAVRLLGGLRMRRGATYAAPLCAPAAYSPRKRVSVTDGAARRATSPGGAAPVALPAVQAVSAAVCCPAC